MVAERDQRAPMRRLPTYLVHERPTTFVAAEDGPEEVESDDDHPQEARVAANALELHKSLTSCGLIDSPPPLPREAAITTPPRASNAQTDEVSPTAKPLRPTAFRSSAERRQVKRLIIAKEASRQMEALAKTDALLQQREVEHAEAMQQLAEEQHVEKKQYEHAVHHTGHSVAVRSALGLSEAAWR